MARIITTRFSCTCVRCGKEIPAGIEAVWQPGMARHIDCPSQVQLDAQKPAEQVEIRIVREREAKGFDPVATVDEPTARVFDRIAEMQDAGVMLPESKPVSQSRRIVERYVAEQATMFDQMVGEPEQTAQAPEPPEEKHEHSVREGTYTVVFEDERRTLRIKTYREGELAGKTVVQYMCGPDNESSYKGFAFLNGTTLSVWKRYRGNEHSQIVKAAQALLDPEAAREAGYQYALESGRCCKCNRKLTVPASINRGMGPECAKRFA